MKNGCESHQVIVFRRKYLPETVFGGYWTKFYPPLTELHGIHQLILTEILSMIIINQAGIHSKDESVKIYSFCQNGTIDSFNCSVLIENYRIYTENH